MFPEGAGYQHDELHLRTERSDEQRQTERRNGDSHLAFIGAGLRTVWRTTTGRTSRCFDQRIRG